MKIIMNNWNNFEIKLNTPTLITKPLLKSHVEKFCNEKIKQLDDNHYILFILRLKYENNQIITASTLQKIDKINKDMINEYLFNRINLSNESYSNTPIKSIIFSYVIKEGKIDHSTNDITVTNIENKFQIYYTNKLPIIKTGNPSEYGKILFSNNEKYTIFVNNKTIIILELLIRDNLQINKIKYIKNGQTLFNWTDTILSNNSIIRDIGKSAYYYENMELVLVKSIKKSKPIDKVKVSKTLNNKIITMDLETILIENIHVPYLLSWFDGSITKSYFIKSLDPVTIEL